MLTAMFEALLCDRRGLGWSSLGLVLLACGLASPLVAAEPAAIDFRRDVRPILSNHCFQCHGPDEKQRQAELRLDLRAGLFPEEGESHLVRPGQPQASELFARVTSTDESARMPPAEAGKPLSAEQIETLRRWIAEGANWEEHWAYARPARAEPPAVDDAWARNEIDRFVLARLRQENLQPAPEAERATLIRRLSLDLTGLPPSPEDVQAFLADNSPEAYANLVERLLRSPHYGERMAMYWLDLVRYADTNGIHGDNHRDHAPYRDYVIEAFNRNLPFDQFTIEQLAGDLLPSPDRNQRIASGYNRLNMTTQEGGAQAKEYIAKYAADRVRNASTVWLGGTLGCAECHDHKFDPFTTADFYRFAAFFADVQETAVGTQQVSRIPTEDQQAKLDELAAAMRAVQARLAIDTPEIAALRAAWAAQQHARLSTPAAEPALDENLGLPSEVAEALRQPADKRTAKAQQAIVVHYRSLAPPLAADRKELAHLESEQKRINADAPAILVAMAGTPRTVRVLPRGNWLDDSGEVVQPGVPRFLGDLNKHDRATRLDLARWLVSEDHPLTARVFVNRLWKLAFGDGLARNEDDFGSQGPLPTHPELLDWLAVEFVDSGWDVKHMLRLMVTSAAYRMSSTPDAEAIRRDPYNLYLARQARFRLDAEMVRDTALAASGLLVDEVGGLSVKPYQPEGYWDHLNFPKRAWVADTGKSQYRRGLYTYWCRTFLHPSLLAFDAPTREECTVDRPRSNTPLQALVLLNDPTYVESARALAEQMLACGDESQGLKLGYLRVLAREPRPEETRLLLALLDKHLAEYRANPAAAAKTLNVGLRISPGDMQDADLAAWTSVARVLLNLHEAIMRY